VSSQFGLAARNRRKQTLERSDWEWELVLVFDGPVVLEQVERSVMNQLPILLPASGDLRQVVVEFQDADYSHPPQGSEANGTAATYRLVARVFPK